MYIEKNIQEHCMEFKKKTEVILDSASFGVPPGCNSFGHHLLQFCMNVNIWIEFLERNLNI